MIFFAVNLGLTDRQIEKQLSKKQMEKESAIEQLLRICSSTEFSNKPLMIKFLRYLVDKHLNGEGDQLKAYTIATELFGRGENFDPDQIFNYAELPISR